MRHESPHVAGVVFLADCISSRETLDKMEKMKVFNVYGLAMNFEQYVLVGGTVRSYLSWMKDTGKISVA